MSYKGVSWRVTQAGLLHLRNGVSTASNEILDCPDRGSNVVDWLLCRIL